MGVEDFKYFKITCDDKETVNQRLEVLKGMVDDERITS